MEQKQYNKLAIVYAILGFVLVIAILISQITSESGAKIQSFKINDTPDTIEANIDTLDYNWEDVGY